MRSLLVTSALVALLGADAAGAQRVVTRGPGPGASYSAPGMTGRAPMVHQSMPMNGPMAPRPMVRPVNGRPVNGPRMMGHRWGNKVNGRWYAGVNAPGGWHSYRRPVRGYALPSYWISPSFVISDWSAYGLPQPPYGYSWSRYYDDAVLIDGRGSVYDSVGDVNWDRYDDGGYADDRGYGDPVYADDDRYAASRDEYRESDSYARHDNGVGGAVTGGVVGGVAGNLIGGRGNRLGGTLIGAGVGAAAGYAIDKHEDDRRGPPPPRGYGADYPAPAYAPPPPPPPPMRRHGGAGSSWVSPDGSTRVVTTGGGYGGSTTVVTVQTAPVVTTTTTEIYEDTVTYSRPKKAHSKRVWRRRPTCGLPLSFRVQERPAG